MSYRADKKSDTFYKIKDGDALVGKERQRGALDEQIIAQSIAQEFMNSFALGVDLYTLRDDAPTWVEDGIYDFAITAWDRRTCWDFAKVWAEEETRKLAVGRRRDEFVHQFANTCVEYYAPRAIEWLNESEYHMDSASEYLGDIGIRVLERMQLQDMLLVLVKGGQKTRAADIASRLWQVLEERLQDTIDGAKE